jgi:PEP-CTERM motif
MTPGMRLARLAVIGLCAAAQAALSVPNRVPEPPDPPVLISADPAPAPRTAELDGAGRSNRVLRDTLVRLREPDAGGAGLPDNEGAPVAEPSTLLLVSAGLFGLILWNRRRR